MGGQDGIDALEHTGVQHPYLATATLFSRGSDDHHAAGQFVQIGFQSQSGRDGGHGDEVVAAAVADIGQCVVFRENGYGWAVSGAPGEDGGKGRLHSAHAPLNLEAVFLQGPRQQLGGMLLLVVQFGMGMDVQSEFHQFRPCSFDRLGGGFRQRIFVRGWDVAASHGILKSSRVAGRPQDFTPFVSLAHPNGGAS